MWGIGRKPRQEEILWLSSRWLFSIRSIVIFLLHTVYHHPKIQDFLHPSFSSSKLFLQAFLHPSFSSSKLFFIQAFLHSSFSWPQLSSSKLFHHRRAWSSLPFSTHSIRILGKPQNSASCSTLVASLVQSLHPTYQVEAHRFSPVQNCQPWVNVKLFLVKPSWLKFISSNWSLIACS